MFGPQWEGWCHAKLRPGYRVCKKSGVSARAKGRAKDNKSENDTKNIRNIHIFYNNNIILLHFIILGAILDPCPFSEARFVFPACLGVRCGAVFACVIYYSNHNS